MRRLWRWLTAPWRRYLDNETEKRIRGRAYELEIRAFRRHDYQGAPRNFHSLTAEAVASKIFAATAIDSFTMIQKRGRAEMVLMVPSNRCEIIPVVYNAVPAGVLVSVFETDGFVFMITQPEPPFEESHA